VELKGLLRQPLRYGENPHQSANAYSVPGERCGVLQATVRQGKELSYNNIVDLDAAWCLVRDLARPGVAIIKHANPCGAAEGGSPREALISARRCDPVSAFGGVYAFNVPVDRTTAETLVADYFVECAIAPSWDAEALEVLASKKNLRVLEGALLPAQRDGQEWKRVAGGILVQDWDDGDEDHETWRIVTKRPPTEREAAALAFAWRVTRHVKSNAIVFAAQDRTLAVGAGQSSRVDSVELCVLKAKKHGLSLAGAVVGSDAFFPFRDGVDVAAAAGATAVIQPGGSVRDDEVIAAADEHGIAMVLTGRRHFRH
jgi:phosphoribosylaminoimidazolecarboxamide formyltransferase/IMP cyclohydrolase